MRGEFLALAVLCLVGCDEPPPATTLTPPTTVKTTVCGLMGCEYSLAIGYGAPLDLNRIVIAAATENLRSQRLPKRLGFKREGVRRQAELLNGAFVDHVVFSLLLEEYLSGGATDQQ